MYRFQTFHHHLSKRDLRQIFDVDHPNDVPEYTFIEKRYQRLNNDNLEMQFSVWNETFILDLWPNQHLISPHLVSAIYGGPNRVQERKGLPENLKYSCHYQGFVRSHNNISAAISNCNNLMGILVMPDHFLIIQTIPQRLNTTQRHIIYKRSPSLKPTIEEKIEQQLEILAQEESGVEFCDVSESVDSRCSFCFNYRLKYLPSGSSHHLLLLEKGLSFNYSLPSEAKLDSLFIFPQLDPITLEVGLFLDARLYEHFQKEYSRDVEQHLLDYSLALINNVHVLYQQSSMSPNLDIVIVRYELWKVQPTGLEAQSHRNGQAQIFLNNWCKHQASINPGTDLTNPGHWDHGILLTGFDIYHTTPSVAGVAPVARMCDPVYACSLVEGLHLGRSFVLAHEMGHNMGMVHDGVQNQCSRSCCLMSQVNGAGKTTWSACSVREFNAFLLQLDESGRGNCLRDAAESISAHDHLRDGRLPGQRFTPDQQCSYFWGKDFHVEIPQGRNMEDICRILWCGNSGAKISTAHPALEGSWCGGNKFCLEGQCRKWSIGAPPPKIDGAWSEWNSNEHQCPILQCQITGSIRIKSQMRMCTNPAPNNGGKRCVGSQIRGILCDGTQSFCKGMSRQEYGTKLCTAIKNDVEKPDIQLSGPSFQHATQPCKVWCHLVGSELIRHKGQYPDGSPCGIGRYCVGGQCLKLSCNNEAVVNVESDCPSYDSEIKKWSPWNDWSEWSSCSASCGLFGTQQRERTCKVESEVKVCFGEEIYFALCDGIKKDLRSCQPTPPACKDYSEWQEWSKCSATCGQGIRERKRLCLSQKCNEKLNETEKCNEAKCPEWSSWEEWSKCSVTCGAGTQVRVRKCSIPDGCDGNDLETKECNEKKCVVQTWGDWHPCSASCGSGFQIRERLCDGVVCPERERQARTCNVQTCPAKNELEDKDLWDTWSDWLPCSETCGEGVQIRIRKCFSGNCLKSKMTEQRRCVLRPCPQWSFWSEWTDCTTCSTIEKRTRFRVCKAGLVRANETEAECPGPSEEIDTCDNSCKTIIRGVKTQVADSLPRKVHGNLISKSFEENKAHWNEWEPWQSCSASCGTGVRFRLRTCAEGHDCSGKGSFIEAGACNEQPCDKATWLPWSDWSECSVTCGKGQQTRHRKCQAPFVFFCDGPSFEETECIKPPCQSENSFALANVELYDKFPKWSDWSDWSQCSCFTMNQFRRRYCEIIDPSIQGFCTGSVIEQKPCVPVSCVSQNGEWSNWGPWSQCSKKGSYCIGYSFDQRSCKPVKNCTGPAVDGGWSEWTEWSSCSGICINGHQSRTRYCTNPQPLNGGLSCSGKDFEMQSCTNSESCSKSVDGNWGEWTEWSRCSANCGFAFQKRQRFCDNPKPLGNGSSCHGLATMISMCSVNPCESRANGQWSPWSKWSNCLNNCQNWTRISIRQKLIVNFRTRTCSTQRPFSDGYPCFGISYEEALCEDNPNDIYFNDTNSAVCLSAIRNANIIKNFEINNSPMR
uniref:Peptidase M12B domain-containing protein n=1 Tax=Syphacia muris TaxID=451379 RepID=A0A158R565_9BILA